MFLFFYSPTPPSKKNSWLWLSPMQEKTNKWKTNLSPSRPNSKIWKKIFSTSIFNIQPWTIDDNEGESSADTRFSSSNNFCGSKLDFPRFNGDDLNGWIYRENKYFILHNTFDVNKSPLASFIWNMNPFNGSVGTSRFIKSQTRQIFANSFCNDFFPSAFDDFTGALTKLRQTGTMRKH